MKTKNRKQTITELDIRRVLVIRKQNLKGTYYPSWMYIIGKRPPKPYMEIIYLIGGFSNGLLKWAKSKNIRP